ncbi:MAG: serine/threonine protein kinase [Alphaproteobacteria bacterium]|nr:serine/threonine protein kinase [Alphaproteobacteria bacterium]
MSGSGSGRVGPYRLESRLARGGMGEVWQARHDRTPVVLKFVHLETEDAHRWFQEEVRAHARLRHPHVIEVLDLGTVEHDLEGGPVAGTPWMALERASGGDLRSLADGLSWAAIRVLLLAVLDALAHAHARGVIHRDLKPANVLLAGPADLRPGVKLADFGIAHLVGTDQNLPGAGTPATAAPEQVDGDPRALGPWTDLYALGCTAYRLLCGRYPFDQGLRALAAHATRTFPPLTPRLPVPAGVDEWVARLTRKRPEDRYGCAADAAYALLSLPELPGEVPAALAWSRAVVEGASTAAWGPSPSPAADGVAPPARDWRRPASPPLPDPLSRAGLNLFPLRRWETVGPEGTRDELWESLVETRRTGMPHVVLLRGPSGSGVTHLGRWLCEQAATLGMARVWEGRAHPEDAPDEALLRSIASIVGVQGLTGRELALAVERPGRVDVPADDELNQVVVGLLSGRVTENATRRGTLRRLLADRSRGRAGVWWLDDARHSPDAVRFAWSTVRNARGMPLLLVLGAGEADDDGLRALEACERVRTVRIAPLSRSASRRLVNQLLPLSWSLAARVVDGAEGRPRRLVRRLDALVAREALRPSTEGFVLREGVAGDVALDDAVVSPQMFAGVDADMRRLLTVAAVLGDTVRHAAWVAACAQDVPDPGEIEVRWSVASFRLADNLVRRGLMRTTPDGWSFTDRAFVEGVLAWADPVELRRARGAVARLLAEAPNPDPVRIASLLDAAGDVEGALTWTMRAVLSDNPTFELRYMGLARLCADGRRLADLAGLPPEHPHRETLAARALQGAEEGPALPEMASLALVEAQRLGWPVAEGVAHAMLAMHGDPARFDLHAGRAQLLLGTAPLELPVAFGLEILVQAWTTHHRYDDALIALRAFRAIADARASTRLHALVRAREAHLRRALGQPEPAEVLEAAAEGYVREGYLFAGSSLLVLAGDSARMAGDLDRSDSLNRRAAELTDILGVEDVSVYFNLAFNAMKRGDVAGVRRWLDAGHEAARNPFWRRPLGVLEVGLATLSSDLDMVRQRWQALVTIEPALPLDVDEKVVLADAAERVIGRDRELAARMSAWADDPSNPDAPPGEHG